MQMENQLLAIIHAHNQERADWRTHTTELKAERDQLRASQLRLERKVERLELIIYFIVFAILVILLIMWGRR